MMTDVETSTGELAARLRSRWTSRFPDLPVVGASLVHRYADPARVYHDLRHLTEVLAAVDTLVVQMAEPVGVAGAPEVPEIADRDAVELAAWFHDAVYDVGRPDNEAASAELARALLGPELPGPVVEEVVRLVLLTRDHAVAGRDPNGAVLCDADLAVLAGSTADYDDYARRVRAEYAAVPDAAFRSGRAEVLLGLLELPRLFHTAYGAARWEASARANLRREISMLRP